MKPILASVKTAHLSHNIVSGKIRPVYSRYETEQSSWSTHKQEGKNFIEKIINEFKIDSTMALIL